MRMAENKVVRAGRNIKFHVTDEILSMLMLTLGALTVSAGY